MPFGGLGIWEVLLVLLVILVVFGPRRLPELGGALGKGIREFKRSFREIETELRNPIEEEERKEIGSSSPKATESASDAESTRPPARES